MRQHALSLPNGEKVRRIGSGFGYERAARRRAAPTQSRQALRPVFRHCVGGGSLATFRCANVAHAGSWSC